MRSLDRIPSGPTGNIYQRKPGWCEYCKKNKHGECCLFRRMGHGRRVPCTCKCKRNAEAV